MKFKGFAVKLAIAGVIIAALVVCLIMFYSDIIGIFFYIIRLLAPFIIAFILSLAADPLAEKLHSRFKLPRGLTAILVIILIVGIIGGALAGLIWKLISELKSIYTQIPEIYQSASQTLDNINASMSELYKALPSDIAAAFDSIGERLQTGLSNLIKDNYKPVVTGAGNFAKSLPSIFIGIIVFILSSYFMISSPTPIKDIVKKFIPKKMANGLSILSDQIKKYLGGYVKAQLIIMSIAFVLIFTGMTILKIPYSMLIALGIAFFDALPFFGSGAILIPWSVIAFITSDIRRGIGMLIIYLSVIFTRQMIEPKIVSSNIGVNPILTLMSMYIGYKVFSIGGMILGPIILMLTISLYKAGAFNGIIRGTKKLGAYISREAKELINNLTLK
mgnify:CR=1 FL=1